MSRSTVRAAETAGVSSAEKIRDHSFASLDLMRGLAALVVLFQHSETVIGGYGLSLLPFSATSAVDVFMLISGFLMMWHYYERGARGEEWTDPLTFSKFYVRRFFRIAPLYYFLLLVTYSMHGMVTSFAQHNLQVLQVINSPAFDGSAASRPTLLSFLAHLTFLFGFIPRYAASTLMPDWSIGLEMQFYFFFPLLAIFLVRSQFIGATIFFLILKAATYHFFAVGMHSAPKAFGVFPFPTLLTFKIDNFLVGMLLACGLYDRRNTAKCILIYALALVIAGLYMEKFLLVCLLFLSYELASSSQSGIPAFDLGVGWIRKIVGARIFKFMADTSYGVYLIHPVLLTLAVHVLIKMPLFLGLNRIQKLIVTLIIIIPTANVISYIGFKLIESPGIQLGRIFVKQMTPRGLTPLPRRH